MIVKTLAFGNNDESFIENRFEDKVNIIFSNDNNRGKTLLMQSILYSIGYESIFPSGFNPKEYYFYSKLEFEGKTFEFLRRNNSIISLTNGELTVSYSISEFKYYFDKEIINIPKIEKDGELKLADLTLFYELFFLGQDKRNTSNLIVKGRNNKEDFKNLIYSYLGVLITVENKYDIDNLKKEKKTLESEIQIEIRKNKFVKKNPEIASFISANANNRDFKDTSRQLKELHHNITDLNKRRLREENRKMKLESLVSELNSLNRNLNEGKVICSDCGSDKIIFSNQDFKFEVSNKYVRQNILKSIGESIALKKEIIEEYNHDIKLEQDQISKLISSSSVDAKNYILFEDEMIDSKSIDKIIDTLQKKIDEINEKLKNNENKIIQNKDLQRDILRDILSEMRRYYKLIDPEGLLEFNDLFTKNSETYSGSEEQEYYFCKMIAINNILGHDFPIIIDSFREGELSTSKEKLMIKEFIKLDKQVILTSTLKDEEYDSEKYFKMENINVLDYSKIEDSKILQSTFNNDFRAILDKFNIS